MCIYGLPYFYRAIGAGQECAIRAAGAMVPNIITDARTGHLWGNGRGSDGPASIEPTAVVH
jgi:hypothetical protein